MVRSWFDVLTMVLDANNDRGRLGLRALVSKRQWFELMGIPSCTKC